MEDGYEFFADRSLVTVFSAPNYCGEFENNGAVMSVDENLMCSFQILKSIWLIIFWVLIFSIYFYVWTLSDDSETSQEIILTNSVFTSRQGSYVQLSLWRRLFNVGSHLIYFILSGI